MLFFLLRGYYCKKIFAFVVVAVFLSFIMMTFSTRQDRQKTSSGTVRIEQVSSEKGRFAECKLYADTGAGGLGHRFSALIFAALTAHEIGAELHIPSRFWSDSRLQGGKTYEWFAAMLQLPFGREDPPKGTTLVYRKEELSQTLSRHNCRAVLMSGHGNFCNGTWCMSGNWPGAFRKARSIFKRLVSPKDLGSDKSCSWHVRAGDITLSNSDSMIRLFDFLHESQARCPPFHYHIISERALCSIELSGETFQKFCVHLNSKLGGLVTWIHNSTDQDDLMLMIKSQILVSSGSSFAYVAAELSSDSQIVVSLPAKEPGGGLVYDRGDTIFARDDGSLSHSDLTTLRSRISRLC